MRSQPHDGQHPHELRHTHARAQNFKGSLAFDSKKRWRTGSRLQGTYLTTRTSLNCASIRLHSRTRQCLSFKTSTQKSRGVLTHSLLTGVSMNLLPAIFRMRQQQIGSHGNVGQTQNLGGDPCDNVLSVLDGSKFDRATKSVPFRGIIVNRLSRLVSHFSRYLVKTCVEPTRRHALIAAIHRRGVFYVSNVCKDGPARTPESQARLEIPSSAAPRSAEMRSGGCFGTQPGSVRPSSRPAQRTLDAASAACAVYPPESGSEWKLLMSS